jgi:hypothetical protein
MNIKRYCQIKNENIPQNPERMGVSGGGQGGTNFCDFSFGSPPSWNLAKCKFQNV